MGAKASQRANLSPPTNSSRHTFRSYAKWDHHVSLATHDISRFTMHEMNHLKRHQHLSMKEPRLTVKKSESAEELADPTNVITVRQLIANQSQRRKSFSTTDLNQLISIQQIPSDLQLVLINEDHLQNLNQIGKGNFGTVYRALYKGTRDVALKTFNEMQSDPHDTSALLHEAFIMTRLQHENLLRILGVTFFGIEKRLALVTDLMKNGSLLDYLRNHRELLQDSDVKTMNIKLNSFVKQIFRAMLYLEEKSIIHRDLAARNCLIGEDETLKVADFGLTKLTECGLYKGNARTIVAIRWSAPEAIFFSKYSSRSDVWSYGITVWEIYALGERPFGNLPNQIVRNILKNPSENVSCYLPKSTQFVPQSIYTHLILPCLTSNIHLRPRFRDLEDKMYHIFNK